MIIQDVSEELISVLKTICPEKEGYDTYYHVCNPSLLKLDKHIYVATFRSIIYRVLSSKQTRSIYLHPWKMWDNGYKYFFKDPDRGFFYDFFNQKVLSKKKRHVNSPDFFIRFQENLEFPTHEFEVDTTSLVLMEYLPDYTWKIKKAFPFLFGHEMNVDARLHQFGSNMFITYNTFNMSDQICMLLRPFLYLNDLEAFYFFEERPLIHPDIAQTVEKNCVLINDHVLYSIFHGECTVQPYLKPQLFQTFMGNPLWRNIFDATRDVDAQFSLGTNVIPYRNNHWLMMGHVKIPFKEHHSTLFQAWLDKISWKNIYQHGKYIYYMLFIELNDRLEIIRASNAFIPTNMDNNNEPFLLVFPTGIAYGHNEDEVIISYGEGDVRCKTLSLHIDDVEELLLYEYEFYPEFSSTFVYQYSFLNIDQWNRRRKIFHVGYFFEDNVGDDQFLLMFRYLQKQLLPQYGIRFRNCFLEYQKKEVKPDDIIIYGGGDVINSFFLTNLPADHPFLYAISVGIPYLDNQLGLDKFKVVSLRNPLDYHRILSDNVPKPTHLVTYPDLAFLIPRIKPTIYYPLKSNIFTIGISLPRTWYQKDSQHYLHVLIHLSKVFRLLLQRRKQLRILLIPFCLNHKKHRENDVVLNRQLHQLIGPDVQVIEPSDDYVWQIDSVIHEKIDFMICGRFHAHIFSINRLVPFMSLSMSRKCRQLMMDLKLERYSYTLRSNIDDCPIMKEEDVERIVHMIEEAIDNQQQIQNVLKNYLDHVVQPKMTCFLSFYKNLIHSDLQPSSS